MDDPLWINVSSYDTLRLQFASCRDTNFIVIKSFKDKQTEAAFNDEALKGFPINLLKLARRKLMLLDAAVTLQDLASPPGNRLEALIGNRLGQHSIRVNDQYRICFVWTPEGPLNVEFIDYH